jgi:polysaccharide export outer membrane protein
MMGAVAPQVLPMPAGNMTILDALASSGDIGEKGRIDNVLVIRDTAENAKEFKRLDLRDNSIFYSPYFYLQPDDIIYVEPKQIKVNKTTQLISYVTAGITFLIFIFDRIIK